MSKRQRRERVKRRRLSERSSTARRVAITGGATLGATLAMGGVADAATFTVTNTNDSGSGSLRDAINQANAMAGKDTINFAPGVTGTLSLASHLAVTDSVDIVGPGAGVLTLEDPNDNVFDFITNTQASSISGLSIEHSKGGIYAGGNTTLTVSDSVISGNAPNGKGGGINSYGDLTVVRSTISGNTSSAEGAGIYAEGQTTIQNSTISGNETMTDSGGGIYLENSGSLLVENSTISGNTATYGGGIYGYANLTVTDSTISGNHAIGNTQFAPRASVKAAARALSPGAGRGGGIYMYTGESNPVGTLQDTIVSGNTAGTSDPDLSGHFDSAFSLVQSPGSATISETVPNSDILNQDPLLGPLQNNGGPTQTMLPSPSSPVINKGNSEGLSTDQRGFARPVQFPGVANSSAAGADGADMGAVELQVPIAVTNPASGVSGSAATLNGSVNPENESTTYQFQYGTSTSYGSTTPSQGLGATDASSHGVSGAISGLAPNTTYHFRVLATNSDGATSFGADMTFTTPAVPIAITGPANHVSAGAATVTGSVNPEGQSTLYDFQYGLSTSYGSSSATNTLPAGSTAVAVQALLHGLTPGKTYHYRVAALNAGGAAFGADMTFKEPLPQTAVQGFSARACVAATVNARVSINDANSLKQVTVRVDGRQVLHTTHAHFNVKVAVAHLGAGRHTVQITGIDSTGAHFTRTLHFNRCAAAALAIRPPFTG